MQKHMPTSELDAKIDTFLERKSKRLAELEAKGSDIDDPGEIKEFDTHGWFTHVNHPVL